VSRRHVNVKFNEEEWQILQELKSVFSENTSNAIRRAVRFARALSVLPISEVIKPVMLEQLLKDREFRKKATLADVVREIPQLEERVRQYLKAGQ